MKYKTLFMVFSLVLTLTSQRDIFHTTYDETFEDRYQVEHLKDGDGIHYPEPYKFVRMKFKGFVPATGQVFESSDLGGGIWEFMYRKHRTQIITGIRVLVCWDEAYPRMSTGEKIVIMCPSDQAFGSMGYIHGSKQIVKPGETVGYEFEMIDAQYDPFRSKVIKKGINDIYPRFHDLIVYKWDAWVGEDREFLVASNKNSIDNFGGVMSFDNSNSMCINEALRKITVGGIIEVYCPSRYTGYGVTLEPYHVPNYADHGYRIQLLSLKELNWHKQGYEK